MDNQATVNNKPPQVISGKFSGKRLDSRVLEEQIQEAVARGQRSIEIHAFGQHGIGGRLWRTANEPVHIKITGQPGQRVGSMGFPNTFIEVLGPASDDVGWLNAGLRLSSMEMQVTVAPMPWRRAKFLSGNIGARGMTMTKHNPRFAPPELWVLGSAVIISVNLWPVELL